MDKQKKKQRTPAASQFGAGSGFIAGGGGGSFRSQTISNRYDPMRYLFFKSSVVTECPDFGASELNP